MQFSSTLRQFLFGLALLGVATGSPVTGSNEIGRREDCRQECNDAQRECDGHSYSPYPVFAFGQFFTW